MNILIVGGGMSGLALAAFLKDSAITCDVIEKCHDWSHQGFLIGLWDNGRDILKKLGLADRLDAAGSRVRVNSVRDGKGRVIKNYSLSSLYSEFGGGVTVIDRAQLHAWLLEKSCTPMMNRTVRHIEDRASHVEVEFTDGERKSYDLVVGADGVHSSVRSLVFGTDLESFTNWRAWYVWIDTAYAVPAAIVQYIEPREYIATFSVGTKTLATMIAPAEHQLWDTREGRIERLKKLFKDEIHIVPTALEHVKDSDILPTDLVDVHLRRTVTENVALIGDAAHCVGPLTGLGTSMALEDAYTLAGELLKITTAYPLKDALAGYEARRRRRRAIVRHLNTLVRTGALSRWRLVSQVLLWTSQYLPESMFLKGYRKLLRDEI